MLVRWGVEKQINRSLIGGIFTKGFFLLCSFVFLKNDCDWMSIQHGLHKHCLSLNI